MAKLRLRTTDLQWRSVEGEVVALDLQGSQYLGVNNSGVDLWAMLAAGTTRAALVEHLASNNNLAPGVAAEHVEAFLTQLESQHLIDTIE